MKHIIILNGSPRPKGNTSILIEAFTTGAISAGHAVRRFDLYDMHIRPCIGCSKGGKNPLQPCMQQDDMSHIYPAYLKADVVVFASPLHFWSISTHLKCALDRLYAVAEGNPEYQQPQKECILLMVAAGNEFEPIVHYYESLVKNLNWSSRGMVLANNVYNCGDIAGHQALSEAQILGSSIG